MIGMRKISRNFSKDKAPVSWQPLYERKSGKDVGREFSPMLVHGDLPVGREPGPRVVSLLEQQGGGISGLGVLSS